VTDLLRDAATERGASELDTPAIEVAPGDVAVPAIVAR
jgi:hypothetical protein